MSSFHRKTRTTRAPRYQPGTWFRVRAGFYSIPLEAIVGDVADTRHVDLGQLGFHRMSTMPGPKAISRTGEIVLDLASRLDADFYLSEGIDNSPVMLFGARFQEPHPDDWWKATHARGSAIVVLGSTEKMMQDMPDSRDEFKERLSSIWVAEVPLLVHGWESGVGTHNET